MKQKTSDLLDYEKFVHAVEVLKLNSELKKNIFLKCNSSIEMLNFVYNSISEVKKLAEKDEKEKALSKLFSLTSRLKEFQ